MLAVGFLLLQIWSSFFGARIRYRVTQIERSPLTSLRFRLLLKTLTQSEFLRASSFEVWKNGGFYEAELAAIMDAKKSITLEAFIFHRGEIASRYVKALAERARAGVQVKMTLDYIGSFSTKLSYLRELTEAGGIVRWYHPLKLDLLLRANNRTHRELLVVDGTIGFVGGRCIADWWWKDSVSGPRWRDTMLRVEGPVVSALQSVFAQNWLRVAGEILTGEEFFPFPDDSVPAEGCPPQSLVIGSTPSAGSTQARTLFQTLIASAQKCVYVSTPYFLPDRSAVKALVEAVRQRHVEVKILTPGDKSDQRLARALSRALYGRLLPYGVRIFEYQPSMIHVKALMVDDCWAVVGSTNFDYRSFDLNDEVNLAMSDEDATRKLTADFHHDLADAREITYEEWRKKWRFRMLERLLAPVEREV